MTVQELRERIRHLSGLDEVIFFPANTIEGEDGTELPAGLGYFDVEEKEYVYLGEILVIDEED